MLLIFLWILFSTIFLWEQHGIIKSLQIEVPAEKILVRSASTLTQVDRTVLQTNWQALLFIKCCYIGVLCELYSFYNYFVMRTTWCNGACCCVFGLEAGVFQHCWFSHLHPSDWPSAIGLRFRKSCCWCPHSIGACLPLRLIDTP